MAEKDTTMQSVRTSSGRGVLRTLALTPLAAAAGWVGYSTLCIPHQMPLPAALTGSRREFDSAAGRLSYYVAGQGAPLLLIHSVNAAASSYEVRPLFEHYAATRRVYALDLPGFGFSVRDTGAYTPRRYTNAILAMVGEIQREQGPDAIDALALSLGAEFLARAAAEAPARFRTIALVSPTGFGERHPANQAPGQPSGSPLTRSLLDRPLWGRALFDLLNSGPSARWFLEKTFGSKQIDEGLAHYDYLTSHQPNAQHAPFAFIAGLLFSADIRRVYESLTLPVWLAHGTRGDFTDYRHANHVAAKPHWRTQIFPTGALPHFERGAEVFQAYDAFLAAA